MKRPALDASAGRLALPPPSSLPLPDLAPIAFGPEVFRDLAECAAREWWSVNGIGGYASSTLAGLNTRPEHGLLVAALKPPLRRVTLLSKVEETLVVPGGRPESPRRFELATHRTGGVIHPEGYRYVAGFRFDPWPSLYFQIGSVLLEKSVFMLPGENAVVIGYTLHAAPGPVQLEVRPLSQPRPFGETAWGGGKKKWKPQPEQGRDVVKVRFSDALPPLVIHHTAEMMDLSPCWHHNFEYRDGSREDLWSPGRLLFLLKAGEACALVASTGRRGGGDLFFHRRRVENTQTVLAQTLKVSGFGSLAARLAWTAESFAVRRPAAPQAAPARRGWKAASGAAREEVTLLSGVPKPGLSGREVLIALPGLTLVSQRFELARSVLESFAARMKGGLLPVRWTEETGEPRYDSADTSLWFFWAVWHFWRSSRHRQFVAKKLLGPMEEIVESYLDGTEFGVGMDEDGLLTLTDEEQALTWMDARWPAGADGEPGAPVTPRFGKPVEINALWYCALSVLTALTDRLGFRRAATYRRLARLVEKQFHEKFLDPGGGLYDRLTPDGPDAACRPNAVIAVGLPFCPLGKAEVARVVEQAHRSLWTPRGLRTLAPDHPDYHGRPDSGKGPRPEAIHQGTVWAWLIGPYVSALLKARGSNRATRLRLVRELEPLKEHLLEEGIGSVSERFDGDPPHRPQGCPSHGAAVGEILRALHEAKLESL